MLMDNESYKALANQQRRENKNLMNMRASERERAIKIIEYESNNMLEKLDDVRERSLIVGLKRKIIDGIENGK